MVDVLRLQNVQIIIININVDFAISTSDGCHYTVQPQQPQ